MVQFVEPTHGVAVVDGHIRAVLRGGMYVCLLMNVLHVIVVIADAQKKRNSSGRKGKRESLQR